MQKVPLHIGPATPAVVPRTGEHVMDLPHLHLAVVPYFEREDCSLPPASARWIRTDSYPMDLFHIPKWYDLVRSPNHKVTAVIKSLESR